MDIKSLMIGDWVQLKTYGVSDKFERTEAYIYVKVAEIGSGLITVEYNNDIKEPYRICENTEIEPIPLTPEILEKNGWIKDGYFYKAEDGSYIQLGELFEHASFRAEKHGIPREIQTSPHLLKYIHQLQHALRLCGIEKEIEL